MAQEWKICRKRAAQGKFANFGPCDDCHQIEIFNHVNQVESGVEFNRNVFHLHIIPCLFFAFTWLGAFPLWKAQNPLNFLVFLSLSLSLYLVRIYFLSAEGCPKRKQTNTWPSGTSQKKEKKFNPVLTSLSSTLTPTPTAAVLLVLSLPSSFKLGNKSNVNPTSKRCNSSIDDEFLCC